MKHGIRKRRCLVQGCHDGVGRLVIDMVNPARLAVSAFFWLKWMASLIDIGWSYNKFFGMRSFLSKLVMMKKKKTSIYHYDGDDYNYNDD